MERENEGDDRMKKRIRELEIKADKAERKERRTNIIIRGVNLEGKRMEEEVEEIGKRMGIKMGVKEVRKIGNGDDKGRGMVWVRLEDVETKRRVIAVKKNLKGGKEDDLTVGKRKIRWKIEEARREKEKGKNIGYMEMWINRKMERWDEVEEG